MREGRKTKKIVIQQRISGEFRIPFYEQLYAALQKHDIELVVVYGRHSKLESSDRVASFHCGEIVRNRYFYIGQKYFFWQPILRYLKEAELIILQQGSRNLMIYPIISLRKLFGYKLAFWGHGQNFQTDNPNSLSERLKRTYSLHADHWFAYTDLSKKIVCELGFPKDRITSVNNAIDTTECIRISDKITEEEIEKMRRQYSVTKETPVGIFCSRLYREKRIDFLLKCVTQVKERVSDFQFFVIGNGPDTSIVDEYARNNRTWFHYIGLKYGRDKVKFFKLAHFQLMPGLVGLHIVDSFAHLTPIITTDIDLHSPEINYLENGINGIMTENTIDAYVGQIVQLIKDKTYQERLIKGCMQARKQYTIENMVVRFVNGIEKALSEERKS